jgi:hypothetical protein
VIATPYGVTFDHAAAASAVTTAFSAALEGLRADPATAWAAPRGVPTHGVGHSMGAHLHALAAALLLPGAGDAATGTPHASLALLAYNNRPVAESIPVPLDGVRAAVEGLGGFASAAAAAAGIDFGSVGGGGGGGRPDVPVPASAAGAGPSSSTTSTPPSADALIKAGLAALASAGVAVDASTLDGLAPALDQFSGLAGEVGAGAADFSPSPAVARQLISSSYSVPRTLLIAFAEDAIDETPALEAVLRAINDAGTVVEKLPGTHVTPCGPDVALGASPEPGLPSLLGLLAASGAAAMQGDARRLGDRVVAWLDATPVVRAMLPGAGVV